MKHKGFRIRWTGQEVCIYKGRQCIHAFAPSPSHYFAGAAGMAEAKTWIDEHVSRNRDQSLPVEPPTRGRDKLMKG